MLVQILVGASIGALNIVVHALLTVSTIRVARSVAARNTYHPWWRLFAIMIAARADADGGAPDGSVRVVDGLCYDQRRA